MHSEEKKGSDELSSFFSSGIYRLRASNSVFIDPVRVLDHFYSRHSISASTYYCRSFDSSNRGIRTDMKSNDSSIPKQKKQKKKRKRRHSYHLNERELVAGRHHQEIRPFLMKAHEALLGTTDLLLFLPNLMKVERPSLNERGLDLNFVELGRLWQAPLYDISMRIDENNKEEQGLQHEKFSGRTVIPLFNNLICNYSSYDAFAEFQNHRYILPSKSCFHMSALRQIHDIIPGCSDQGFNLIVIDPPWENGSASQKAVYPTLPNRHFMYLPVKQLAHSKGALVALWMTNRCKLRAFAEKELLPSWGATDIRTYYWLKVKPNGSLLCELDLIHHKPYEILLLAYVNKKEDESDFSEKLPENQVILSIPGAYSRKPPLGSILT